MAVKYAAPCAFVGRVGNKVPKKPAAPMYSEHKGSTFSQNSLHSLSFFSRLYRAAWCYQSLLYTNWCTI